VRHVPRRPLYLGAADFGWSWSLTLAVSRGRETICSGGGGDNGGRNRGRGRRVCVLGRWCGSSRVSAVGGK